MLANYAENCEFFPPCLRTTAALIPVFLTWCPVVTKWGDYDTFNNPTVAEYLSEQLLEC